MITAYNADVQRYIQGAKLGKIRKETIIESIKESVLEAGKSFSRLFPNKQYIVLDEIIFLLSGKGIWKIGADTLAERTGASVRTVKNAVKSLKETGEVLVCRLADKHAGKYIFIYKNHPNFKQILQEVFFIDELPTEENALLSARQSAPLENPETPGAEGVEGEKTGSNHINSFNLKQENKYIKQSIETDLIESQDDKKKELERISEYYTNEFQETLYHTIKAGSYHAEVKRNASILGLRVGSNCDELRFQCALRSIAKVSGFLHSGGIVESVPALFSSKYKEYIEQAKYKQYVQKKEETKRVRVPFYNWLENESVVVSSEKKVQASVSVFLLPEEQTTKEELNKMGVF